MHFQCLDKACCDITMVARCCKTVKSCDPMFTMDLLFKLGQFGLTTTPNFKLIVWYQDRIEIDASFSVMAVTTQTPKWHHNLGCASVVVTFGSLWYHDRKLYINSFIPAWISNHIHYKLWDEITYPFSNFNGCTVDVWELINNFIPQFAVWVIIYPCWD